MNLIDINQFTTAQVASAANVPHATLQSWIARSEKAAEEESRPNFLLGLKPDPAIADATRGKTRLWSVRRAMHVAIVVELTNLGLHLPIAAKAALQFTDIGGAQFGWAGDPPDASEDRYPCELFATGDTVLIAANDGDRYFHRVLNVLPGDNVVSKVKSEIGSQFGRHSFAMVDINELSIDTLARLRVDRDLLSHRQTKK